MKILRVLGALTVLVGGDMVARPEVASASTSYQGYVRCEDLKVRDLVPLRSTTSVSLKASTTLGYTNVEKKGSLVADETKSSPSTAFGIPATKTHAFLVFGPTTANFDLGIERESKDSAALDVAVCVGHMRLGPDGDEQKSETVAKGSLLAGDSSEVVWSRKAKLGGDVAYVVLVQPRSLNTSTRYRISIRRRS